MLLDPGFGFAKTPAHNHALLRRLPELQLPGPRPAGGPLAQAQWCTSRWASAPKRPSTAPPPCTCWPCRGGARLLRVHDVAEARQTIALVSGSSYF
ncbi:MAG: hypothetical protein WKG07_44590 [Hymenobacter sp.]